MNNGQCIENQVNTLGVVYFVQARGTDRIKIGFSKDVKKRLQNLQIACPFDLQILCILDEMWLEDEQSIHAAFWDSRVKGEWFKLTPTLQKYLNLQKRKQTAKARQWTKELRAVLNPEKETPLREDPGKTVHIDTPEHRRISVEAAKRGISVRHRVMELLTKGREAEKEKK